MVIDRRACQSEWVTERERGRERETSVLIGELKIKRKIYSGTSFHVPFNIKKMHTMYTFLLLLIINIDSTVSLLKSNTKDM